jgi:prolyl oligopeptidase
MNPFFSPNMLLFTHHDGIFAIAHVRGGGELGDDWHKSGMLGKKPNTWKDFIACAEFLVAEKYTSKEKLACYSGSAGGILVGRAMTDRPDLFSAVIPEVGFMNPTRTENDPLGEIDIPEFGDPSDSLGFLARLSIDSYHHLVNGENYPATLVTAGMNDPRVIAWQPAKFAARLQAANASGNPVLFWIDYESGHGIGDSKTKQFESLADALGFALWHTGHPDFQAD